MGMHRCRCAVHSNVWFPCISIATFSSQQNFHSKFFLPTTMPQQNNNPTDVLWGTKTPVDFWQGTVVPRDNCFHRNKKILWMCCGELKSLWIYSRGPWSPVTKFPQGWKNTVDVLQGIEIPMDFLTGVRNSYGSCVGNQTFLCSVSTAGLAKKGARAQILFCSPQLVQLLHQHLAKWQNNRRPDRSRCSSCTTSGTARTWPLNDVMTPEARII